MRISDWSSDVCSSDLEREPGSMAGPGAEPNYGPRLKAGVTIRVGGSVRAISADDRCIRNRRSLLRRLGPLAEAVVAHHRGDPDAVVLEDLVEIGRAHV